MAIAIKDCGDNLFGLVDARFGKELANKRGLATLEITDLFNRRYFQALDPGRAWTRILPGAPRDWPHTGRRIGPGDADRFQQALPEPPTILPPGSS